MFGWIIKYLGFLKSVPLLARVFDSYLKMHSLVLKPELLDWIDEIEAVSLTWSGVYSTVHKYGGMQLNVDGKEIGHIHSNGLLDILLNRQAKAKLLADGRVTDHHTFFNSGWISFYIRSEDDKEYAKFLLKTGYLSKLTVRER